MIRSMTGFARTETACTGARLSWEIRSVNHRYLDVQFKMPDDLRVLEPELRVQIASRVARGKVECALRVTHDNAVTEQLDVDPARVRALRAALDNLAQELGPTLACDPLRALAFPGVLRQSLADPAPLLAAARQGFGTALDDFSSAREREGARLGEHLRERLIAIEDLVRRLRQRIPQVRDQWLERLRARCADLGVEVEPQRLAQEVALAAQRLDIDEEMSRLQSHVSEVRDAMAKNESAGRRLDFLMQEFNREANTTSSKSQDAETTKHAVEMKVLIEQMREQVQNIE